MFIDTTTPDVTHVKHERDPRCDRDAANARRSSCRGKLFKPLFKSILTSLRYFVSVYEEQRKIAIASFLYHRGSCYPGPGGLFRVPAWADERCFVVIVLPSFFLSR